MRISDWSSDVCSSDLQMATLGPTPIASEFVHIRIGGDLALLKGMMRVLFEREAAGETALDHDFLAGHTVGFAALRDDVMGESWPDIVAASGISEEQIRRCAEIYIRRSEEHTSELQSLMRISYDVFLLKKKNH